MYKRPNSFIAAQMAVKGNPKVKRTLSTLAVALIGACVALIGVQGPGEGPGAPCQAEIRPGICATASQIAHEPDISGDSPSTSYVMGDANPSHLFVGPTK